MLQDALANQGLITQYGTKHVTTSWLIVIFGEQEG
jgi:hypothetical protein